MHEIISVITESLTIKIVLGAVWTATSFFTGAYVGHRFNLSRDKRREFNDACLPARKTLMEQLRNISNEQSALPMLKVDKYWEIRDNTPKRKQGLLDNLWNNYCQSNENDWCKRIQPGGKIIFKLVDKDNYMKNIQALLKFTDKR